MKKTIITLLALAAPFLFCQQAKCQEVTDVTGYYNVWLNVESAGGGKVFISTQEQGLKVWRDKWEFKQTLPSGQIYGLDVILCYLFSKPDEGYVFGGWYVDDGDGVFDITKDELLSVESNCFFYDTAENYGQHYDTKAAASAGEKPAASQATFFAYFTNGATATTSFFQGLDLAGCGSVYIDKPVNSPGDEVTVRALPEDGYQFEYWQDAEQFGNIVSRENPYTFTVKGGERLYAYFTAIDAPSVEMPADGAYRMVVFTQPWIMTDLTMMNGAHVVVLESEDLKRDAEGRVYLDASNEDTFIDVTQSSKETPSLIYGKGTVSFAYKMSYGFARKAFNDRLIRWSGDKGISVTGADRYFYAFNESLQAFVQIGNTDTMLDPSVSTTFKVPAGLAYFSMDAFALTDDEGNIPSVIALSPEGYDKAVASVPGVKTVSAGHVSKTYNLMGVEVKGARQKGLYIVDGKKVVVK